MSNVEALVRERALLLRTEHGHSSHRAVSAAAQHHTREKWQPEGRCRFTSPSHFPVALRGQECHFPAHRPGREQHPQLRVHTLGALWVQSRTAVLGAGGGGGPMVPAPILALLQASSGRAQEGPNG